MWPSSAGRDTMGGMPKANASNRTNVKRKKSQRNASKRGMSSIMKLRIAVIVVAAVVVLSVVFAFFWPGWAVRKAATPSQLHTEVTSATPTIKASPLPKDASSLLSAMPDSVANFARTSVKATTEWKASEPVEEYSVVYSNGTESEDATLIVGQWATSAAAQQQYDSLNGASTGDQLATGNIKVDGKTTGSYVVKQAGDGKAVAIWKNDTAVFKISGPTDSVETLYEHFPL